jgi:hypothetical protein
MQLYRQALKTCLDWSGSRQQWYARVSTPTMGKSGDLALETIADVGLCLQARAIRAEFEANRNIVSGLMLAFRLHMFTSFVN